MYLLDMRHDITDLREQSGYLDVYAFAGYPWKQQKQSHSSFGKCFY